MAFGVSDGFPVRLAIGVSNKPTDRRPIPESNDIRPSHSLDMAERLAHHFLNAHGGSHLLSLLDAHGGPDVRPFRDAQRLANGRPQLRSSYDLSHVEPRDDRNSEHVARDGRSDGLRSDRFRADHVETDGVAGDRYARPEHPCARHGQTHPGQL